MIRTKANSTHILPIKYLKSHEKWQINKNRTLKKIKKSVMNSIQILINNSINIIKSSLQISILIMP